MDEKGADQKRVANKDSTSSKSRTRWNRFSSSKQDKSNRKQSILYNEFSKANANEPKRAVNRRLKLTSLTVNKRLFRKQTSQKEKGSSGTTATKATATERTAKKTGNTSKGSVHPNKKYLVQIVSNIWGTKFKFFGQNFLQSSIGQITYKTSLFHLQPRQMKIILEDLSQTSLKTSEPVEEEEELPPVVGLEVTEEEEPEKPIFIEDCRLTQSIQSLNEIKPAHSLLSLDFNADKKSLKNLISIKTSATLGAIPDIMAIRNSCDLGSIGTYSSPQISKSSSHKDFGSYELSGTTCNDEIATVQELVEHKFSYNGSSNFFEKFHLPILTLVDKSLEVEDYVETNNLITSKLTE